jgi:hypothetical protein
MPTTVVGGKSRGKSRFIGDTGMRVDIWAGLGWAVIYAFVGGVVGMVLVLLCSILLPKVIERLTPKLDEEKEMARGNVAVAEYFGRVVAACILGVSIIIAAAILAGIIAALLPVSTYSTLP